MTYSTGTTILATDYNTFRGSYDALTPYPDDASATNKLAALIGVGYGVRGYGQTVSFPSVTQGDTILASSWTTIKTVMNLINVHTGAGLTLQPSVVVGDTITAQDGTSGRANISSLISSLDSAKLTYDISQMALSSVLTSTRNTSWNTQVYHEFTITFGTEDQARYFFNSGGTVYASASRVGGTSSSINTDMTDLLSAMGTIKIASTATTYTGTGGTAYAIGYYGLTNNYQTLFMHAGTGAYTSMTYTLKARRENYVGLNGGNGSLIRVQAVFDTGLDPTNILDGTLTSSVNQLIENGGLVITAPTFTTITSL